VLAETDVINMVSRGIATPDILKGIHLSMASRIVKLLKVTGVKGGTALLTGGLALDTGLLAAIQEEMVNEKVKVEARSHPDSIYAGAIGAALWGAFRHAKLNQRSSKPPPPPEPPEGDDTMALLINDNCTACDACKPVCPNERSPSATRST
jgi:NAD-dependent dihydropyrimidine dehydrogenase PreA subunit